MMQKMEIRLFQFVQNPNPRPETQPKKMQAQIKPRAVSAWRQRILQDSARHEIEENIRYAIGRTALGESQRDAANKANISRQTLRR